MKKLVRFGCQKELYDYNDYILLFWLQIKMAYEEFGKLLKRLMEGEAFVYVSDFINSSMVKYDKVNILIILLYLIIALYDRSIFIHH